MCGSLKIGVPLLHGFEGEKKQTPSPWQSVTAMGDSTHMSLLPTQSS